MIAQLEQSGIERHHDGRVGAGGGVDVARVERAVREILLAIGEDPDRDGLKETPARVARAYREMFRGMRESPARHLGKVFELDHDGDVVIVRDVPFASTCEHHLLPFMGKAHVAYLPAGGKVVGLSKLARVVDVYAKRPQVQERMTRQVADAIERHLGARGVAVVIESEHLCMRVRGANKPGSVMVTSTLRGAFLEDRGIGGEVLNLMLAGRRAASSRDDA